MIEIVLGQEKHKFTQPFHTPAVDLRNREYVFNYDHFGYTIIVLRHMKFVRKIFFFLLILNLKTADILQPSRRVKLYKVFYDIMAQENTFALCLVSTGTLAVKYVWGDNSVTHIQGTQKTFKPPDLDLHVSRPHIRLLLRTVCQIYKEMIWDIGCITFK